MTITKNDEGNIPNVDNVHSDNSLSQEFRQKLWLKQVKKNERNIKINKKL